MTGLTKAEAIDAALCYGWIDGQLDRYDDEYWLVRFTEGRGVSRDEEVAAMDGVCHCGAVRWRFEGVPRSATSCNCSICRRYGALWAYGFEGEGFTLSGETSTYVWNRERLAFHFCARCACVVAWLGARRGQDGRLRGAVNLRLAAEPGAVAAVPIVHHDTVTMSDLPRDGRCVADVWS